MTAKISPRPSLDIVIDSEDWAALADLDALAERAVLAALAQSDRLIAPDAELCIVFTGDDAVQALNRQWRGLDKPTNVLSFPAVAPAALSRSPMVGDIALAFETIAREAADEGKTLSAHATHLIVHGALHLLGYDHLTDPEAEDMEAREIRALAELGIANPYADP